VSRFGVGTEVKIDLSGLSKREQTKALVKQAAEIRERKTDAIRAVRLVNRINETLETVGAGALGIVGIIARFGNTATEQARAIAIASGIEFSPEAFNFDAFPEEMIGSAQIRSNIMSLAFAIARAREGTGRLTDKDVQRALDTLGASTGSKTQMRAAMAEVVHDTVASIDEIIVVNRAAFEGTPVQTPSLLSDDLKELGMEILPRVEARPQQDVLPEGIPAGSKRIGATSEGLSVYETPDGRRLVVE
jgi:hypothetical protein